MFGKIGPLVFQILILKFYSKISKSKHHKDIRLILAIYSQILTQLRCASTKKIIKDIDENQTYKYILSLFKCIKQENKKK